MKILMKKAGSGAPSANRITLLRDIDGDGVAGQRSVFLKELNSPFGMALVGDTFYVADTDAVLRFPYQIGQTQIAAPGTKVVDLPRWAAQPSLDQERARQPRWLQALCDHGLQQQRQRKWGAGGGG